VVVCCVVDLLVVTVDDDTNGLVVVDVTGLIVVVVTGLVVVEDCRVGSFEVVVPVLIGDVD